MKLLISLMLMLNTQAVLKDAFSGKRFFYLDQADRIEILTDLYKQTKAEYALWEIKKRRIGVDGDKVFTEALEMEKSFSDVENSFDQAKSNLLFIDRVKLTIAKFQDTHFGARATVSKPWILTGLETSLAGDGKVYITGTFDKPLQKTIALSDGASDIKKIKIGNELLEVDGKPVATLIEELKVYVDASTEAFAKSNAAYNLMARTFAYPSKPYADVKVKLTDGKIVNVRLPWYYSDSSKRKDAVFYFETLGFPALKDLRFKWDEKTRTWTPDRSLGLKGYNRTSLPKGAIELENWTSAKGGGSTIVRSALILKDAKAYGYLSVNSFAVTDLYKGDKKSTFIKSLQGIVKYFKEQNLDMILDLRHNGGGNGGYPEKLLAILTEKDTEYANTTWAKRITRYMRQFVDYYAQDELYQEISNEDFWQEMVDQVFLAANNKLEHTPSISEGVVKTDEVVKGYDGKIVAMISPNCISACDIMSMLLKGSKRATIIGTTSNGTGAGYWSNEVYNTQFKDRYQVISTRIPNTLFGYPGSDTQTVVFGADSAYEMNSENVPTKADVEYNYTLKDFKEGHTGWIEKALEQF